MRSLALPLAIALVATVPALAQPAGAPGAQVTVDAPRSLVKGDPNQVICRSQRAPGSRLRGERVCATRQQWADQRRQDRQLIEKAQTTRVYSN